MKYYLLVLLDYVISSVFLGFIIFCQCHCHLLSVVIIPLSPTAQVHLGNFNIKTWQFPNFYSNRQKTDDRRQKASLSRTDVWNQFSGIPKKSVIVTVPNKITKMQHNQDRQILRYRDRGGMLTSYTPFFRLKHLYPIINVTQDRGRMVAIFLSHVMGKSFCLQLFGNNDLSNKNRMKWVKMIIWISVFLFSPLRIRREKSWLIFNTKSIQIY